MKTEKESPEIRQETEDVTKYIELTKENAKDGTEVIVSPSVNILRFLVDSVSQHGVRGMVRNMKGKDGKEILCVNCVINLISPVDEIIENENIYVKVEEETADTDTAEVSAE